MKYYYIPDNSRYYESYVAFTDNDFLIEKWTHYTEPWTPGSAWERYVSGGISGMKLPSHAEKISESEYKKNIFLINL